MKLGMNQYWEVEKTPACFKDYCMGTQCIKGKEHDIQ